MKKVNLHHYIADIRWTGNKGQGTVSYQSYERNFSISNLSKPPILASSDPAFSGDAGRYNPEELLIASLSGCHMLWYLHLCAEAGVNVVEYQDKASGIMEESGLKGGIMKEVTLNPVVVITPDSSLSLATELHSKANQLCYIANSVKFPVHHNPVCKFQDL